MTAPVVVRRLEPVAQLNLRGDVGDAAVRSTLARVLGVDLPQIANGVNCRSDGASRSDARADAVLWMGPDERLIVAPSGTAPALESAIRTAIGEEAFVSLVDVSAGRVGFEVRGPGARELLAFGCALDLDAPQFVPDRCAQTLLARANVVLWQTDDLPTYRILVRPSFASYLESWLQDAMMGLT